MGAPKGPRSAKVWYLDRQEFQKEIEAYMKQNDKSNMSRALGEMLYLMGNKISGKYDFIAQSNVRDDAILLGVEFTYRYIHNYHPSKGLAFNYVTSIMISAHLQTIKKENKRRYGEMVLRRAALSNMPHSHHTAHELEMIDNSMKDIEKNEKSASDFGWRRKTDTRKKSHNGVLINYDDIGEAKSTPNKTVINKVENMKPSSHVNHHDMKARIKRLIRNKRNAN